MKKSYTPEEFIAALKSGEIHIPRPDPNRPLVPPWVTFPDYARGSMGWRMGSGEDEWHWFWERFTLLPEDERTAFIAKYPEPEGWEGIYESAYESWSRYLVSKGLKDPSS